MNDQVIITMVSLTNFIALVPLSHFSALTFQLLNMTCLIQVEQIQEQVRLHSANRVAKT